MRYTLLLLAGLIIVLASTPLFGGVAPVWAPDLAANADGIVVGSVKARTASGTVAATVDIERVLKGPLQTGSLISFLWSVSGWPAPPDGPLPDDHGLFFLQRSSTGNWTILPVSNGNLQWRDVFIQTPTSIAAAITAAATASLPANPSALDKVLLELVAAMEAGAPLRVDLAAVFRSVRSPVLDAGFRRFVLTSDPRTVALGLGGLIAISDASAIQRIQHDYSTLASDASWPAITQAIRYYYTSGDQSAISSLGVLTVNRQLPRDLRVATATALARVHSQLTLPYLARLLDEADPALQAAAVGGLSSFANNVPVGAHEPAVGAWAYRTDETIAHSAFDERLITERGAYYIAFWKSWWQEHQATLAQ